MDRRAFMMTGAWLSAATGALPWTTQTQTQTQTHAAATRNAIALVDTGLASARAFSRDAARRGIAVFEIDHDAGNDIGTLWYTTLAPRLAAAPGLVIGVVRASDYFVLGELALRSTGLVEHRCERCAGRRTPVAFLLGPATKAMRGTRGTRVIRSTSGA